MIGLTKLIKSGELPLLPIYRFTVRAFNFIKKATNRNRREALYPIYYYVKSLYNHYRHSLSVPLPKVCKQVK